MSKCLLGDQSGLPENGGQDSSVKSDTHDPCATNSTVNHDQIVAEDEGNGKEKDNRVENGIGSPPPESLDVELEGDNKKNEQLASKRSSKMARRNNAKKTPVINLRTRSSVRAYTSEGSGPTSWR